jgi:hypothetical protein
VRRRAGLARTRDRRGGECRVCQGNADAGGTRIQGAARPRSGLEAGHTRGLDGGGAALPWLQWRRMAVGLVAADGSSGGGWRSSAAPLWPIPALPDGDEEPAAFGPLRSVRGWAASPFQLDAARSAVKTGGCYTPPFAGNGKSYAPPVRAYSVIPDFILY